MESAQELKEKQQRWDDKNDAKDLKQSERGKTKHQPPKISPMVPCTQEAYGGGLYGKDDDVDKAAGKPKASDTQSADGPVQPTPPPKHQPPPSSGDRDIDITGQSYIQ